VQQFEEFQARRGGDTVSAARRGRQRVEFVHTMNGSALASENPRRHPGNYQAGGRERRDPRGAPAYMEELTGLPPR